MDLIALILFFIAGYFGYAKANWDRHYEVNDLVVLIVFSGKFFCAVGEFSVTADRVGVAFYGRDIIDASTLIKNADDALYRAKNEGRNRIAVNR